VPDDDYYAGYDPDSIEYMLEEDRKEAEPFKEEASDDSTGLSHLPRHLKPRHVDSHQAHSHPIVALQGRLRLSSFAEV
jgi:hypothetical protein